MKFIILLLARPSALVDMSSAELIIAMVGDCQVGKVPAASHTYESALHLVMMYRDLHTHTRVVVAAAVVVVAGAHRWSSLHARARR